MELLSSPKAQYLLEADLEVLHEESREWLSTISYWRDEIAFFYTLMVKKADKHSKENGRDELTRIQEELLHLSGKELSALETEINQHENYLGSLLESNSSKDERTFRDKHKALSVQIRGFEDRIKKLKKEIFELTKKQ